MKREKKHTDKELALAHVFPHGLSAEEKKEADKQLWEIRKKRLEGLTEEKKLLAELMKLKFRMDQYSSSPVYDTHFTFSYFLNEYIHFLRMSKTDFSRDISLHLTQLSRLLNNKEKPNDRILIRLEIHSDNSIPAISWYRLLEKQNELELINDKSLRESEKKNVKRQLVLTKG